MKVKAKALGDLVWARSFLVHRCHLLTGTSVNSTSESATLWSYLKGEMALKECLIR